MGNVCCGTGDSEMLQRQELLKEGNDFKKKSTYLGVLSKTETIYLQLNSTSSRLVWRQTPGPSKTEEIPIHRIGKACSNGSLELVILARNGQKLLELTAQTTAVRDLWAQTLEEICQTIQSNSNETDAKSLSQELAKQAEKQREKYWKDRTNELEQRRLDAEEAKKRIGLVGMKYTAQAMARK